MDYMLGTEREALHHAMVRSFDSHSLSQLVAFRFNPIPNTDIYLGALGSFATPPLEREVAALIDRMDKLDRIDELVQEATEISKSVRMARYSERFRRSIQRQVTLSGENLERMVVPTTKYVDPAGWRRALEVLEPRVCQVQAAGAVGSGFLIAPDLVLTNWHVVRGVPREQMPGRIKVLFDFRRVDDMGEKTGTVHRLHTDALVDSSPPSPVDSVVGARDREPSLAELDYAILRLATRAGDDVVGEGTRGWIPRPVGESSFDADTPVLILQHPSGGPLRLAMEMRSVIEVNVEKTRLRYRTNTADGSSGSPCFDQGWRLIALHHSGDPDFNQAAGYNEGIPIETIAAVLTPAVRAQVGW